MHRAGRTVGQLFGFSFWGQYARVYDGLRRTVPYQRLIAQTLAGIPLSSASLLDAGCGTGNLLEAIRERRRGVELFGVDRSAAMLERARRRVPSATFVEADLDEALPWPSARFDAVTCINVLYAVKSPERTLAELHRVLKPGGVLVASSPREKPKFGPLVREHASVAGWLGTLPMLLDLAQIIGFNLLILRRGRRGQYHFLDADKARRLLRLVEIDSAYAGQNWFARVWKPHAPWRPA